MSGTHAGTFRNISATGRKIKIDGVSIDEISKGKIISGKDFWDTKILDQQLGI
jgi:predicted ester cyclase